MSEQWIAEMKKCAEKKEQNIKTLKEAKHLDDQRLRSLDSTLKKVTAFTKKLKSIGSTPAAQFLPDLDRYNLSKYLDEIAANICEAKIKTSDLESLIEFCVKLASLYKDFPENLIQQFRKQMPTKKGDKIENPSKLRVDLRFFSELLLNGLFIHLENEGVKLLGSVLVYLLQTDKQEHANVSVLMPFCRNTLFAITGILPLSMTVEIQQIPRDQLISSVITPEKRNVIGKLFNEYWDSLIDHANKVRTEMNKLHKSIKRQERTRGDASSEDRQHLEQAKQAFDRLHQNATELGECLGRNMPEMPEEPSDDEREEAATRRLNTELSEGRVLLWPDRDTQLFYESLLDVTAYTPTATAQAADAAAATVEQQHEQQQIINESIENVDLSCLEEQLQQPEVAMASENMDEEEEPSMDEEVQQQEEHEAALQQLATTSEVIQGHTINFQELLERLPHCINKELIDAAAIDFLKNYSRNKANRKRLVLHFNQAPIDRLDLLPFYARFMATIRPAYPDIPSLVLHELLTRFRSISQKDIEKSKKLGEMQKLLGRIEPKLHLCAYFSELCKFAILPKAEALTCLRSLLVQMRSYKVDMLSVMIEQMGPFLYRSPDAHSKMAIIMEVLREKSANIKDPRQKILLENAYFAVIPPEDQANATPTIVRQPPMHEFIKHKLSTEIRVSIFRRINWDEEELREFTLKLLSSPWRIHFGQLACLASLVSALGDHHDWISVRVLDDVLEFIRLSLELNLPRFQQCALSSVAYLGQLFNYNVSNTVTLFKILYQLISLGIQSPALADISTFTFDQLVIRLQRIRLVCQLVDTVCEFFCNGKSKKRMDHFLCFFLRFYYETRDGWSQHVEELDEFPDDVSQTIAHLLRTWRKGETFPTSLSEARERVDEIEGLYKAKVEEVLAVMRYAAESREADAEESDARRLKRIMEEDEDMEDEEDDDELDDEDGSIDEEDDDEESTSKHRHKKQMEPMEDGTEDKRTFLSDEEEEQVRVHTQQTQVLPEDEDFMRNFDRLMAESLQSAPVNLQGPMSDLVVPPQAKQKFERKLTFAVSEGSSKFAGEGLLPSEEHYHHQRHEHLQSPPARMALMLRTQSGKGGGGTGGAAKSQIQLKPVQIAESENLAEKWRKAKEEQERDRREMKKVTLAMNERMAQEAEESHRQQQIADVERKIVFTSSSQPWASSNTSGGGDGTS